MLSLILASGSKSRTALLHQAHVPFTAIPSLVDETPIKDALKAQEKTADDVALALALAKGRDVSQHHPERYVLAADQILTCNEKWYDKPATVGEARQHLQELRGNTQTLHNGICLLYNNKVVYQSSTQAHLTMRPFSDAFLEQYLTERGQALLSSVGACQIEGYGMQLLEKIDGEYTAILGLPMLEVLEWLRNVNLLTT